MRKSLPLIAALALPLSACATGMGTDPLSQILGSIGSLGTANTGYGQYGYPAGYGAYGNSGFSQAAASACANYASRYGSVSVRNVQQLDANNVKVFGHVSRGYANEGWDCTFRSDGRITDFDL